MRKEVLIAIGLGFALGLVITFGLWTANQAMRRQRQADQAPTPTPAETVSPISVSLDSPADGTVSTQDVITLAGTASESATIVIIAEEEEIILEADDQGRFETEVSLVAGENVIEVTAYDRAGNLASQVLTVVLSTSEF